jgi:hypothetical protein
MCRVENWKLSMRGNDKDRVQMANKKRICYLPVMKRCRVSYRDSEGIEHAVELEASSLYEAVGLAIDRFRRCEHVPDEPKGLYEFIVEPRELTTQHRLTRKMFDEWLCRPGGTPAEVGLKTRLRALLGVAPQAFSETTDGKRPARRKREP